MEIRSECSECKKKFDLKIDDSEGDKEVGQVLKERFGDSGTILCSDCEK